MADELGGFAVDTLVRCTVGGIERVHPPEAAIQDRLHIRVNERTDKKVFKGKLPDRSTQIRHEYRNG